MGSQILTLTNDPVFQEVQKKFTSETCGMVEAVMKFNKLTNFFNLKKEEFFHQFGLTPVRFQILMLLKNTPDFSNPPSELARKLEVTRGTMTQFISALEKDGLIFRGERLDDRRVINVTLTQKGHEVLDRVLPLHVERMNSIASVLSTDEIKLMMEYMLKMTSKIREISNMTAQ